MGTFFKKFFFGVILNSIIIWLLNYLLNDSFFKGTLTQLIFLAFVLTFLNLLIKPVIRFIFLPLIWLTLGIFALVINLIILKTASFLVPGVLVINSSLTWLAASIIISISNSFLYRIK